MRLVLPGMLPEPAEARQLLPHLDRTAPAMLEWLACARGVRVHVAPDVHYCTAREYWLLERCGFRPDANQVSAAGLGPLLAGPHSSATGPVWLAELVNISPSRDGAVLIPARELAIDEADIHELFHSAVQGVADTDFKLHPTGKTHWRLDLPQGYAPACASPELVHTTSVNDWWRQDIHGRPWRRLVNELQMLWFDHPVNQRRHERGLLPINSLWLFGGATARQLKTAGDAVLENHHVDDRQDDALMRHDWQAWLDGLEQLDRQYFRDPAQPCSELILTGRDAIVTFEPDRRVWRHLKPGGRNAWKLLWSPPN